MCPIYSRGWPPPPPITPPSWPRDWIPVDRERATTALKNQMDLEKKIAKALNQLETGERSPADVKAALLSAQNNVEELSQYFSHTLRWHSDFYNEQRADDSTTACQVFDIPELLEMILQHLNIIDLLSVYQCCKSIRNSIDGSPILQQQLSLRAAPADSHLYLPLRNMTKVIQGAEQPDDLFGLPSVGFSSYEHIAPSRRKSQYGYTLGNVDDFTTDVHAFFHLLPGQTLPAVGTRIRKMFVTQPPIEEMSISVDCCPSYEYPEYAFGPRPSTPVRKVASKNGLTVGDLYDRSKQLLDEHRYCPSAYSGLIEDDGSVRVNVRFFGKKTLKPDDPIVLNWQKQQDKSAENDRKYHLKSAKLEAFCNAKKSANANGEPTPTLAEFVALHGEDADWQTLAYQHSAQPFTPYGNPFGYHPHQIPPLPSTATAATAQTAGSNATDPSTQAGASTQDPNLDSLALVSPGNGD